MSDWLAEHGARAGIDVITEGETPAGDDGGRGRAQRHPLGEAGCTWWLESRWEMPHHGPERMARSASGWRPARPARLAGRPHPAAPR